MESSTVVSTDAVKEENKKIQEKISLIFSRPMEVNMCRVA